MKKRLGRFCAIVVLAAGLPGISSGQNPVGFWNFNNSGNVGADSSVNSYNLTSFDNAAYTAAGQNGGGLTLDGTNDYLGIAGFPANIPTGGSAYTISAWFKTAFNGSRGIVGWGNFGAANQVNAVRLESTNNLLNYWWSNDFNINPSPVDVDDGNWHHVVFAHNGVSGGAHALWVDGKLIAQRAGSGHNTQPTANSFRIGSTNSGEYFQGTIDDVAIYNTALTGNQVQALFNGSATALTLPTAAASSRWVANDLNGQANLSSVTNWVDNIVGASLTQGTASAQPLLIKNASISGSSAVRFDGLNDNLRLLAANNAIAGNDDFSIAVALRTNVAGAGGVGQWYQNSGIVDAEQPGVTDDWGMVLNGSGQVGGGLGNPDQTTYSAATINNGQIHTAIFTRDDGVLSMYIDGILSSTLNTAGTGPVNIADLVVGSLQVNANYFNGDIFEIRLFDFTLSPGQAASLNAELQLAHNTAIPEPNSFLLWSLLSVLGIAGAWRIRGRRKLVRT